MQTSAVTNMSLRVRAESDSRRLRAPLRHRVAARLHSLRLDRELAADWPLEPTPALAARADQLTAPRNRRRLVTSLREVAHVLRAPAGGRAAAAPLSRVTAAPWAEAMLAAADRLEQDAEADPRALARLNLLLTDGNSPLYNPDADPPIGEALWSITNAPPLPRWTS